MPKWLVLPILAVVAVALVGCGGGGGGGATVPSGGTAGTLQVGITDAPGTYANVVLAIKEIRAVPTGQGDSATSGLPVIVSFPTPVSVDVLTLQYVQQILGQTQMPAGTYEQIRLVLAPNVSGQDPVNYVTLESDPSTKLALTTPSGQESGLKIVGKYTVQAGVLTAVLLDFNPDKAIVQAGNSGIYNLKPTGIRITQTAANLPSNFGSLSGAVNPSGTWDNAVVSVTPVGGSTPIAMGSVSPDDGSFVASLPAGDYYLKITSTDYPTYDTSLFSTPVTYTVTAGATTTVPTIDLSAPGTVSGTVMPSGTWTSATVAVVPDGSTTPTATVNVSSSDGTFSASVPAGVYTLQVKATNYVTYDTALLSPKVTYTVFQANDTPVGTITLTAYGTISGTVTSDGTTPVAGASVSVIDNSTSTTAGTATTDTNGAFSIPVPAGTNYGLHITASGYANYDDSGPYTVTDATDTPVGTITLTPSP